MWLFGDYISMSHYFIYDNKLKSKEKYINYTINNIDFTFKSDLGVFSKDKIDLGSSTLVNYLLKESLSDDILDLGCGYGYIGIVLKKFNNNLNIDMVDINTKAIELTKDNLKLNNINNNAFISNGFININKKYNYILFNPPIKAGKDIIYKLIDDSYTHLLDNGYLYIVIRKNHGAISLKNKLDNTFNTCIISKKNKGYYILKAKK